jgi:hypothetical protein
MKREPGRFRRWFDGGFERLRSGPFRAVARTAFRWRYATVGLALASFILAIGAISGGRVAFQFFPSPEGETVDARIVMAAGTPRTDVEAVLGQVDAALEQAVSDLAPDGEKLIRAGPRPDWCCGHCARDERSPDRGTAGALRSAHRPHARSHRRLARTCADNPRCRNT